MFKISTRIYLLVLAILILTAANGFLIVYYLIGSSNNNRIINRLENVRGLIQRTSKLVIMDKKDIANLNIELVNTVLDRYTSETDQSYFISSSEKVKKNLGVVQKKWKELKENIDIYFQNKDQKAKEEIIRLSEELWNYADNTVIMAEDKAGALKDRLMITFFVAGFNMLLLLTIFWISKRLIKDKLEYLASYDTLTNILNREAFLSYLSNAIRLSKRYKKKYCLIMFDIDFFKKINDTYGHQVGDSILRSVIKIISNKIRESDLLGRYGGEEFLILASEIDIEDGLIVAEKIRKSIKDRKFPKNIKLTISLGISVLKTKDTVDSIIKRVDKAMYHSKENGRNVTTAL